MPAAFFVIAHGPDRVRARLRGLVRLNQELEFEKGVSWMLRNHDRRTSKETAVMSSEVEAKFATIDHKPFPDLNDPRVVPRRAVNNRSRIAKFAFDRTIALVLLVSLTPLLLLIACAIVSDSKGSVLFRQPRFGCGGAPFNVWKFRTMAIGLCDASGARQTADDDFRVTRVGRLLRQCSFDELPQLFNVLMGQMSLVGPRAHPCGMMVEGDLCEDVDPRYPRRHDVRPGITGWAQVNGSRGAVKSPEMLYRRVSLDLAYVSNWSLGLDFAIIVRTVGVVLSRKQAR